MSENNIQILPKHVFILLKKLRLVKLCRNRLTKLQDGTFEVNVNMKSLYLSNNMITHFTKETFPETLIRLLLDGNRLKHLTAKMFSKMKNLRFLHLENNQIISIQKDTFKFHTKLENLTLHGNEITSCLWLKHLTRSLKDIDFETPNVSDKHCSPGLNCSALNAEQVFETVQISVALNRGHFYRYVVWRNYSCSFCECQQLELNCTYECNGHPHTLLLNAAGEKECLCMFKQKSDEGIPILFLYLIKSIALLTVAVTSCYSVVFCFA